MELIKKITLILPVVKKKKFQNLKNIVKIETKTFFLALKIY